MAVLQSVPGAHTFLPTSFLSHAAGEEGGDDAPTPSPFRPCRSHQGRGKGAGERSRGGSVPASVNDTASTTQITPLPQRGRGVGGEGGPHLPPFLSQCRGLSVPFGVGQDDAEIISALCHSYCRY